MSKFIQFKHPITKFISARLNKKDFEENSKARISTHFPRDNTYSFLVHSDTVFCLNIKIAKGHLS